jgi:hypothetical protein
MAKKNARSEVWKHFQVFKERLYKSWTFCIHCNRNVFYTDTMSTGMLIWHLRKHHRDQYDAFIEVEVEKEKKEKKRARLLRRVRRK